MEELEGGRKGKIFRIDDKVYRPCGPWSNAIHKLLDHLAGAGFNGAPKTFGFDEHGNEILSYVVGDVYNYPLVNNIATDQALISAAQLLRQYHDLTVSFVARSSFKKLQWMFPGRKPYEVVCHGDFAPYNVALDGRQTVAMFDFDTAHPAPRIWDIAYAVYCWAPFKTNSYDSLGDLQSQSARAKLFCDAYGLSDSERKLLVSTMINRITALVDYMEEEADRGNSAFIDNISNNHHLAYLADIEYLKENQQLITGDISIT